MKNTRLYSVQSLFLAQSTILHVRPLVWLASSPRGTSPLYAIYGLYGVVLWLLFVYLVMVVCACLLLLLLLLLVWMCIVVAVCGCLLFSLH
jgi:hypothetical protein